jgi:uncharacterized protein
VISGSTGLVGRALVQQLSSAGYTVKALVRERPAPEGAASIRWNPAKGEIEERELEGLHAIVNLAGENVADGRWSEDRKSRIKTSRIDATRTLVQAISKLERPPEVFVSASAIGYYGDRGAEVLKEDSAAGSGFLADVTQAWEAAAIPAAERGVRVVLPRIGAVLSLHGGLLKKLLIPFKGGLGGPIGTGDQYMSVIAIRDLVAIIQQAIERPDFTGAINAVCPQAVTNREFVKTFGQVLKRPAILPAPSFALRLVLGEMADELVLSSTRAVPAKLEALKFPFEGATLESAIRMSLVG